MKQNPYSLAYNAFQLKFMSLNDKRKFALLAVNS